MFDSCDKKEIEELKKKVQELEKLKEFSTSFDEIRAILAEIKKMNEQHSIETKKIVKENDKIDLNKNLLIEFKWIFFTFVMSFLLIGVYFIGLQKEFVGGMLILGAFIIAYSSVILINSKQTSSLNV